MKIPYDEKEVENCIVKETIRGKSYSFDYPIAPREAALASIRDRKPIWILTGSEIQDFMPSMNPDNIARAMVMEYKPCETRGGKDMFGVEWEYVPVAGGSMVKPGTPLLEDANDWEKIIVFPDIDSWDWADCAEKNKDYFKPELFHRMTILNGCWFERLISFMDFEGAAMALLDEDQEDALKALLHKTTDLMIHYIDKCIEYFPVDGFMIHDDWGSQMAPFFSEDAARTFFLPEMKRLVSHVHEKGKIMELHSCGHNEDRCNIFVEAGFDGWRPMPMNDTVALYEKYGDKINIGITYDKPFDPATATEEEQIAAADDFVERFSVPGKAGEFAPSHNRAIATEVFMKELYRASRKKFAEQ